jgi:hypothetical protein
MPIVFNADAVLKMMPESTVRPCFSCGREMDYVDHRASLCRGCSFGYCARCFDKARIAKECPNCKEDISGQEIARIDKCMANWVECLVARARAAISDVDQGK